ncbi:MAG: permease [Candidatus Aminicenantes bacterium]|nr:permease [Candidatus Aminicenantes bacterium]
MRIQSPLRLLIPILSVGAWAALYANLGRISDALTFGLFGLTPGGHLAETVRFFLFDVPKVMLLLVLIVFVVGIIRTFFAPEKTRRLLEGRSLLLGNVMAAALGIVTPFCSCSAVPLFLGFVEAGIPLGVTFSFLIAAPMINEVAVVLLFGLFGWKTAALYMATGLAIAITAGWIIGRLRLERWVEPWVYEMKGGPSALEEGRVSFAARVAAGRAAVKEIVGKVWPYVVAGIAVGAFVHGYVPQNFMASIMGKSAWWSVPVSVLIGVPLYSNAAGIIPIVQALLEKGASLGTALAFMMSVIGLSFPEAVILRKVLRPKLLAVFFGVVAVGIMIVGFIFNMVF